MLTLKGSILGIVAFVILTVLYGVTWMTIKTRQAHLPPGHQMGFDLVTMYHNRQPLRDPFFWVVVIVFMAGGSLIFRR
jgi:hypothetical protein